MLIRLERPHDAGGGVVQCLHELGARGAGRLPARVQPDGYPAHRTMFSLHRKEKNRARAVSPVRHDPTQRIDGRDHGVEASLGYPRELALWRQETLQQAAVAPTGHTDHPHAAGIQRRDDHLRIERPLELIGQPQAHASDRFQGRFLGLRLGERDDVGPAPYAVEQPAQIVLHAIEPGLELVGQQQADRGPGLGMEDQHSRFHSLRPTLLLVPRPLQPAVHGDDLRHRETLRLDDSLGFGPFLVRIQLADPDSHCPVCTPQPFQGGIGKEVRRHTRAEPARRTPAPEEPAHGPGDDSDQDQPQGVRHPRSQPRRRNQR